MDISLMVVDGIIGASFISYVYQIIEVNRESKKLDDEFNREERELLNNIKQLECNIKRLDEDRERRYKQNIIYQHNKEYLYKELGIL